MKIDKLKEMMWFVKERKSTYIIASSESLFIANKNPIETFVLFLQVRYIIGHESEEASK